MKLQFSATSDPCATDVRREGDFAPIGFFYWPRGGVPYLVWAAGNGEKLSVDEMQQIIDDCKSEGAWKVPIPGMEQGR